LYTIYLFTRISRKSTHNLLSYYVNKKHRQSDTHTGPIALPGPLKWSVKYTTHESKKSTQKEAAEQFTGYTEQVSHQSYYWTIGKFRRHHATKC